MAKFTNIIRLLEQQRKEVAVNLASLDSAIALLRGRKTVKRHLSADARRRIGKAQKERWAKVRAAKRSTI